MILTEARMSETFDMVAYFCMNWIRTQFLMTLTELSFSETFDLVDPFEVCWIRTKILFSDLRIYCRDHKTESTRIFSNMLWFCKLFLVEEGCLIHICEEESLVV